MVLQRYALSYPDYMVKFLWWKMPRWKVWSIGFAFYLFANIIFALSAALGPLTVNATLFTLLLVWNLMFASVILHEKRTAPRVCGAGLIIFGGIFSVIPALFTTPNNEFTADDIGELFLSPVGLTYVLLLLTVTAASAAAVWWYEKKYPLAASGDEVAQAEADFRKRSLAVYVLLDGKDSIIYAQTPAEMRWGIARTKMRSMLAVKQATGELSTSKLLAALSIQTDGGIAEEGSPATAGAPSESAAPAAESAAPAAESAAPAAASAAPAAESAAPAAEPDASRSVAESAALDEPGTDAAEETPPAILPALEPSGERHEDSASSPAPAPAPPSAPPSPPSLASPLWLSPRQAPPSSPPLSPPCTYTTMAGAAAPTSATVTSAMGAGPPKRVCIGQSSASSLDEKTVEKLAAAGISPLARTSSTATAGPSSASKRPRSSKTAPPPKPSPRLEAAMTVIYPASLGLQEGLMQIVTKGLVAMIDSMGLFSGPDIYISFWFWLFVLIATTVGILTVIWLKIVYTRYEVTTGLPIEYGTLQAFAYLAGIFFFGEYKTMTETWMWVSGFSGLVIIVCGVGVSSMSKMPWQRAPKKVAPSPA